MTTLIIPDIHGRLDCLAKAEALAERADRVVSLGDWFDAWKPYDVEETCSAVQRALERGWKCLLGNHDVHYFFDHPGYRCSGYAGLTKQLVKMNIGADAISQFDIFTRVGPYLVSHAGFCEATLQYARHEVQEEAIRAGLAGEYDAIFGAGFARGGGQKWGGPTWLDWNYEFEHIDNFPQIVGHTQGKMVRNKGCKCYPWEGVHALDCRASWCIDTSLRHCALVNEETGHVEIERI